MHELKQSQLQSLKEFDNHKMVVYFHDKETSLNGYIAIHNGRQSLPSFGATRIWRYETNLDAIRDALKLSQLMSYKTALANLPYGGAKAVIAETKSTSIDIKNQIKTYIRTVNYLSGRFITGADVGVNDELLGYMKKESPYIVGTKTDPVYYTALGIFYGIEISLKEVFGTESLENRTFAIQGLGKVGSSVLNMLYGKAAKIYVADINEKQVKQLKEKYPEIIVTQPSQIHKQKSDVFVPCALSNVINKKSISALQCKLIAGSANVQLENKQIGVLLHRLGILYAPDYVINAGGLITVVDEYESKNNNKERLWKKIANIKTTLEKIYAESKKTNMPTNIIADQMAEKIINESP